MHRLIQFELADINLDRLRKCIRKTLDFDLMDKLLKKPALRDSDRNGVSGMDRNCCLDHLVAPDFEEVDMRGFAAHEIILNILDQSEDFIVAFLEGDQVQLELLESFPFRRAEIDCFGSSALAVNDSRDVTCFAQSVHCAFAEFGTRHNVQHMFLFCHFLLSLRYYKISSCLRYCIRGRASLPDSHETNSKRTLRHESA